MDMYYAWAELEPSEISKMKIENNNYSNSRD
jgi:hypothetical protein